MLVKLHGERRGCLLGFPNYTRSFSSRVQHAENTGPLILNSDPLHRKAGLRAAVPEARFDTFPRHLPATRMCG